jgi:hypothetical protein
MVHQYAVKPEKLGEFAAWGSKYFAWAQGRAELFKEVRSLKVFSQMLGDNMGGYIERWSGKFSLDKERLVWQQEWLAMIVPGTWSSSIWTLGASK